MSFFQLLDNLHIIAMSDLFTSGTKKNSFGVQISSILAEDMSFPPTFPSSVGQSKLQPPFFCEKKLGTPTVVASLLNAAGPG